MRLRGTVYVIEDGFDGAGAPLRTIDRVVCEFLAEDASDFQRQAAAISARDHRLEFGPIGPPWQLMGVIDGSL